MKKLLFIATFFLSLSFALPTPSHAIENPLQLPNNKFGIHILFPTELSEAAALVNANGGEWGYVVIPIQSGDRDLVKWQAFMDEAKKKKIIPIIRLATEGDYFNTQVWRTPKEADVLDFANFLSSLSWPVKNRYVIVFNEVNRDDEWGGNANPEEYAKLLSYAATVFKSRSDDFFMINAGLDNASINGNGAINQFTYYSLMQQAVPGIFHQIDGLSSHAYPNPAFSEPPLSQKKTALISFQHEQAHVKQMTGETLPVFITETGWSNEQISEETRALYYDIAFEKVWSDNSIVTVVPFLLRANAGPFKKFSFLTENNAKTKQYEAFEKMKKQKGRPKINNAQILAAENKFQEQSLPTKSFIIDDSDKKLSRAKTLESVLFWMFQL